MERKKAQRAIKYVARKYGVSESEVVKEIEDTIAETLETIRRENNYEAMAKWQKIPCAGEVPTAYELVAYLGGKLIQAEADSMLS